MSEVFFVLVFLQEIFPRIFVLTQFSPYDHVALSFRGKSGKVFQISEMTPAEKIENLDIRKFDQDIFGSDGKSPDLTAVADHVIESWNSEEEHDLQNIEKRVLYLTDAPQSSIGTDERRINYAVDSVNRLSEKNIFVTLSTMDGVEQIPVKVKEVLSPLKGMTFFQFNGYKNDAMMERRYARTFFFSEIFSHIFF